MTEAKPIDYRLSPFMESCSDYARHADLVEIRYDHLEPILPVMTLMTVVTERLNLSCELFRVPIVPSLPGTRNEPVAMLISGIRSQSGSTVDGTANGDIRMDCGCFAWNCFGSICPEFTTHVQRSFVFDPPAVDRVPNRLVRQR